VSFAPFRASGAGQLWRAALILALTALEAGALAGDAAVASPAVPSAAVPAASVPAGGSWYVRALRLDDAHRLSTGQGVLIAIVDGGVDPTVPALAGQLVPGAGIGADAAPDGLRDDSPEGHGTSMAGLVAARSTGPDGQPTGFVGVAPDAKILPISTGRETDSDELAQGIRIATDRGARVISLSLGSAGSADPAERTAVGYALAHDVVVVASAGNVDKGDTNPLDHEIDAPANIPGVIAVTGSDGSGAFWDGSAQGRRAVLAAPASFIRAPIPAALEPSGAAVADGTSNSAALVAGVVALVRAEHPTLNAPSVIELLTRTAHDSGPPGWDQQFGYGIVDPMAALTAMPVPVATNPLLTPPPGARAVPLAADEDGLLAAAGLPVPAPTAGRSAPPTTAGTSGPPLISSAHADAGPGPLLWAGGLAASVLAGVLLGALAFALWRRVRRQPGAAALAARVAAGSAMAAPDGLGPPPLGGLAAPPGGLAAPAEGGFAASGSGGPPAGAAAGPGRAGR
jgi:subtilisin family serine protease